ncbi:MAG: hypothetical protein JNM56_15665 [Planctomycetia bacterium]|nr:hypothetical protein [Planctomycetia bacterium]
MPALHLATFRSDATPPAGHPLCGGWIEPVRGVDDPLRALGVILLGMGQPVVLCAVDWCGLRNDANLLWRKALAQAAHTVVENVAVHCVHPHNAPFADVEAQKLIEAAKGPPSLDLKFFGEAVQRSAEAAQAALAKSQPFTHVGIGQAKIAEVASNRRILGDDGKVKFTRTSATKDPKVRAEPEGLIDPWLKTLSFWNGEQRLAELHYYATHPMSYYGDGRVSADFAGLARQKRQDEDDKVFQVYFTGCAGNVTAGKYNDGSKENRVVLRDRMYEGMKAAAQATTRHPVARWGWRVEPVKLPPRVEKSFGAEESRQVLEDDKQSKARRNNAAFQLAWLQRRERPIDLACLDFGKVQVLHLPGEAFVEFQLKAQEMRKDSTVCVASYGDGGPGYIPPAKAYFEGGYEPTVALAGPDSEEILLRALRKLLGKE